MRIIAGDKKGHTLQTITGKQTRPTTDKVREALFQMIGPFFDGGKCLDLFAGSGSLSFEAISRGMNHAIMIDQYPKAVSILHRNAKQLNMEDHVEIYRNDARRALKAVSKRNLCFDIIFLDPPYAKGYYGQMIEQIHTLRLLTTDGMIVCEHSIDEYMNLDHSAFFEWKRVEYGDTTALTILKKGEE
ncbi:methyltransferase [Gracilibacillus halophilus YIM-C55.5]|uniref:Methyltransferase n=1 Tax=Gracilibacillus halophilus YIM-C55.5 TaxID=1308866 RepID=N4WQD9_9BACI|nr:16S rRNA (guanine(966)-N(2))-methyltransferase RsmD [Gracilibacillus halophilus]ENH98347.1 methyltransferase [Gracilibacillus halophilus YIM-C55.5]